MKVLVTGVNGQLGFDVVKQLKLRGHEAVGVDISEMDITDAESVLNVFARVRPEAVVHCAAWTAVDSAEDNAEKTRAVNVGGTENIAVACKKYGAKMVYISTDYVFDGSGAQPWKTDDKANPLGVYGKTKYDGETAVKNLLDKYFIVRTAWVFGLNGNNFVKTMLNLGKKYNQLRVVSDQIGTPTYTYDLAVLLADMVVTEKYGVYHATNGGGFISWHGFAVEIFKQAGYATDVVSVTTEEYGLNKAPRPFNSRLDKSKLTENGFSMLPDWKDALSRYLKEIKYGAD